MGTRQNPMAKHMEASTGIRIVAVGLLVGLMLMFAGCEVLTIHATGGNRGVEGTAVGMKF
jgi:hypothetical protein